MAGRSPGDLLRHPAAFAALVLVILNDRVLKVHFPSPASGKLSDFAGLVYFPLLVVVAIEGARWLIKRSSWQLTSRAVTIAALVVGVAFVLTKTSDLAGDAYRIAIGAALWPVEAIGHLFGGKPLPAFKQAFLAKDLTDLIAVPVLLLPIWISRRTMAPSSSVDRTPAVSHQR